MLPPEESQNYCKSPVCNMNLSFHIEFYKEKKHSYCRDSECFTVYCGTNSNLSPYSIEQEDISDKEIQAYVQQVMDENNWEMLVSIERIEETTRIVLKVPDEIVQCPCGNRFPLSDTFAHWFDVNYCSDTCYDKRPPEPCISHLDG